MPAYDMDQWIIKPYRRLDVRRRPNEEGGGWMVWDRELKARVANSQTQQGCKIQRRKLEARGYGKNDSE